MWVASDGGLYYSSDEGDNLEPRMYGIHGTDFWGFGAGFKEGYKMVGGTYHNGTLVRSNDIYKYGKDSENYGGWLGELGGDNYRGFVNYADNSIGYADNGSFTFSDDRSVRQTGRAFNGDYKCNTSYWTGEYGTYGFHPNNYNLFYSPVGSELWKTEDGGVSFELVHDFGGNKTVQVIVSWSNPDVIYLTHYEGSGNNKLWKSIDAGETWNEITPTGFSGANGYKYIEVDDQDENKVWTILIDGSGNDKVLESIDGGSTWTNISGVALENERVVSIKHHYGTDDGLYVGTRRGVYYKNASMSDWALFNNNLPITTSAFFLEPYYGEGKIRLASQRGVYECDFYEEGSPIAMASSDKTVLNLSNNCTPDSVKFVDHSTVRHASATFKWNFEGGSPATSTLQNPTVVYGTAGTYDVELIVTDAFGTDTVLLEDYMVIENEFAASLPIVEDFNGSFPPANWKLEGSGEDAWFQDWPQDDEANKCASFDNYWDDRTGENYYLVLPSVDMQEGSFVDLSFDYTYNRNGSYEDTLAIVYRTGSNNQWQELWRLGGADLQCDGTDVWWWDSGSPTIEWKNVQLDLSALVGESCVEVAFNNIGRYGNYIWVDNVNLNSDVSIDEENDLERISIYPNPSTRVFNIRMPSMNAVDATVRNVAGQIVWTASSLSNSEIDLSNEAKGVYFLELKSEGQIRVEKMVLK